MGQIAVREFFSRTAFFVVALSFPSVACKGRILCESDPNPSPPAHSKIALRHVEYLLNISWNQLGKGRAHSLQHPIRNSIHARFALLFLSDAAPRKLAEGFLSTLRQV